MALSYATALSHQENSIESVFGHLKEMAFCRDLLRLMRTQLVLINQLCYAQFLYLSYAMSAKSILKLQQKISLIRHTSA